jgi:hypothetical protein
MLRPNRGRYGASLDSLPVDLFRSDDELQPSISAPRLNGNQKLTCVDSESSEDMRRKYATTLGDPLGEMVYALEAEFYWLQYKWQEYVVLFGSEPSRIEVLNRAAPAFFHHIQDVLWDDILMHLSRLTDSPTGKRKRRNLTFAALPPLVKGRLHREVVALVTNALESASFATDWRNRRLAHLDLRLALDRPAEPLMSASRLTIKEALKALHAVLRCVHNHYFQTDLAQEVIEAPLGAERLLYVIYEGVEAEDARLTRLRSGQVRVEDL